MSGKKRFAQVAVVVAVVVMAAAGIGLAAVRADRDVDPETVVNRFYESYLAAVRSGEGPGSVLAEGGYREMAGLHPDWVAQVDALLRQFAESERPGGYDPFLMAQDVPEAIFTEPAIVDGETAYVPVTSSFAGHRFLVTLTRIDGAWLIRRITRQPQQVVTDFYLWYTHLDQNPLVTRAYADRRDLTDRFVEEVTTTLDGFATGEVRGGYDPILLAQDVPNEVRATEVELTAAGARVMVEMLWSGNPQPTVRQVILVLGPTGWQIDSVAED
jgi:hypothetical protein